MRSREKHVRSIPCLKNDFVKSIFGISILSFAIHIVVINTHNIIIYLDNNNLLDILTILRLFYFLQNFNDVPNFINFIILPNIF